MASDVGNVDEAVGVRDWDLRSVWLEVACDGLGVRSAWNIESISDGEVESKVLDIAGVILEF